MTLDAGTRLGPYEILGPLGAGGMGEVYRARDTRLNRDVAIKQSLQPFGERFHREARAIAALNHPNVCTLYDVGPDYLVMELLEGETLARRVDRGALPLDQVVKIGAQIGDALAAAHAKGVTHRDLKPANVMLTPTGAKVLDFGIAVFEGPAADTVTHTQGVIGTPAYMAPEQLQGRPADARTDIFALGLVLLEMISGQRPQAAPGNVPSVPATLPERLVHVVQRCLAIDPDERWQSARDVRRELDWAGQKLEVAAAATVRQGRRGVVALAAALAAVAGVVAGVVVSRMQPPAPAAGGSSITTRTMVALPDDRRLHTTSPLALSPDGTLLAFVAVDDTGRRDLFLREMAGADARLVPGTAGALHPFFGPDGRDVAFFADGFLQRVAVDAGATPFRICALPGAADRGGTWSAQGVIVVAIPARGLFKVAASGGSLEAIGENLPAMWPSFLPDGQSVLYAEQAVEAPRTLNGFSVVALDGSERRMIARRSDIEGPGAPVLGAGAEIAQGVVLASGSLVYGQDPGSVRALPIDPTTLDVLGPSVLLADSVERGAAAGGVAFAVGRSGLLVYAATGAQHRLAWVTRQGIATPLAAEPDAYRQPRLSPDGTQIAVSANDATRTPNMWLVDAVRGGRSRLASGAMMPAWSPDGRQVAVSGGGGPLTLLTPGGGMQPLIDRNRLDATLAGGTDALYPTAFSPDGRYLLVQGDTQDVWRLSLSDRRMEPVLTGATTWGRWCRLTAAPWPTRRMRRADWKSMWRSGQAWSAAPRSPRAAA